MADLAALDHDIAQVLFDQATLRRRVADMGAAISRDYSGRVPLLVGVLKGMAVFMADLLRALTIPVAVDFMAISHYGDEEGVVRIIKDLEENIHGRHVIFVEDIMDTGLTLGYLLKILRGRQPASLEIAVLFNKPARRILDLPLRYKGFDLPDDFVVGYGLDYEEKYRNLPYLGVLKPEVYRGE